MGEAEGELALLERGVEPVRGEIEGGRDGAQHAPPEPVHRVGVGKHVLAEAGEDMVVRPHVGPREAATASPQRIVGRPFALDEERLVEVRSRSRVDLGRSYRVAGHRHVAVVVLVHAQRHLRAGVEPVDAARLGERPLDEALRHVVIDDDEEPDVLERVADLARHRVERAGRPVQVAPDVDDGNRADRGRPRGLVLDGRQRLLRHPTCALGRKTRCAGSGPPGHGPRPCRRFRVSSPIAVRRYGPAHPTATALHRPSATG